MSDLSPEARQALAYWGVIERAARERMTTADLWSGIRQAAADLGLEAPGVTARGVAQLRGIAGGVQASSRNLARTDREFSLEARHVAQAPWSRPPELQNALAMHQVRFLHTTMTPTGEQSEWRTVVMTGGLPATVGDLVDAVEGDAIELARKYGGDHVGVSGLQILAV